MQKQFAIQPQDKEITPEMLEKINRYSRKTLCADEVFVFSAVLCDNEVDRDFECFTPEALKSLAPLFEGKTVIQNHSMQTGDQSARTFYTEVLTDPTRTTATGEPYTYLKAYCYMPKISKNEALIAEINAGIKKEVSVGCAVAEHKCSICGSVEEQNPCRHRRGKRYGGAVCHYTLEKPTDAYEWSFVAVPAQRNAGVTKGFSDADALYKRFGENEADHITISREEAAEFADYVSSLKSAAALGEEYCEMLREKAVRALVKSLPALQSTLAETLCASLRSADLKALCDALEGDGAQKSAHLPQLYAKAPKKDMPVKNNAFKF